MLNWAKTLLLNAHVENPCGCDDMWIIVDMVGIYFCQGIFWHVIKTCQGIFQHWWNIIRICLLVLAHRLTHSWKINLFFPDIDSLSLSMMCGRLFSLAVYWENVMFCRYKTHPHWWHLSCIGTK
jgi:hypothetical protein